MARQVNASAVQIQPDFTSARIVRDIQDLLGNTVQSVATLQRAEDARMARLEHAEQQRIEDAARIEREGFAAEIDALAAQFRDADSNTFDDAGFQEAVQRRSEKATTLFNSARFRALGMGRISHERADIRKADYDAGRDIGLSLGGRGRELLQAEFSRALDDRDFEFRSVHFDDVAERVIDEHTEPMTDAQREGAMDQLATDLGRAHASMFSQMSQVVLDRTVGSHRQRALYDLVNNDPSQAYAHQRIGEFREQLRELGVDSFNAGRQVNTLMQEAVDSYISLGAGDHLQSLQSYNNTLTDTHQFDKLALDIAQQRIHAKNAQRVAEFVTQKTQQIQTIEQAEDLTNALMENRASFDPFEFDVMLGDINVRAREAMMGDIGGATSTAELRNVMTKAREARLHESVVADIDQLAMQRQREIHDELKLPALQSVDKTISRIRSLTDPAMQDAVAATLEQQLATAADAVFVQLDGTEVPLLTEAEINSRRADLAVLRANANSAKGTQQRVQVAVQNGTAGQLNLASPDSTDARALNAEFQRLTSAQVNADGEEVHPAPMSWNDAYAQLFRGGATTASMRDQLNQRLDIVIGPEGQNEDVLREAIDLVGELWQFNPGRAANELQLSARGRFMARSLAAGVNRQQMGDLLATMPSTSIEAALAVAAEDPEANLKARKTATNPVGFVSRQYRRFSVPSASGARDYETMMATNLMRLAQGRSLESEALVEQLRDEARTVTNNQYAQRYQVVRIGSHNYELPRGFVDKQGVYHQDGFGVAFPSATVGGGKRDIRAPHLEAQVGLLLDITGAGAPRFEGTIVEDLGAGADVRLQFGDFQPRRVEGFDGEVYTVDVMVLRDGLIQDIDDAVDFEIVLPTSPQHVQRIDELVGERLKLLDKAKRMSRATTTRTARRMFLGTGGAGEVFTTRTPPTLTTEDALRMLLEDQ